ncbi:MAG: nucleotide exchange factor GrpE [Nitrospirae bacterium]|nr:nucleotide exchange factor GrpE [Magnetococcales bacterium]
MTDQNCSQDKQIDPGDPHNDASATAPDMEPDLETMTRVGSNQGATSTDEVPSEEGADEGMDLATLGRRLEETQAALAASREETLRGLADMQNLRKRTAREVQQARDFAVEAFARDLLSVSDNMERALNAMPDSQDPTLKVMADGVKMVQSELKRIFTSHGVTRMETLGQVFDPNLHQAVQQVATSDAVPGTVVSEFQPGFLLKGRLLRAAMVVIAKGEE